MGIKEELYLLMQTITVKSNLPIGLIFCDEELKLKLGL